MVGFMQLMSGVFAKKTVAGGATVIIPMMGASLPCTITANPLDGDTLTVSYSTDDGDNYTAWSAGTGGAVTSVTAVIFDFPITQLKAVCTGTGVASKVTIC